MEILDLKITIKIKNSTCQLNSVRKISGLDGTSVENIHTETQTIRNGWKTEKKK